MHMPPVSLQDGCRLRRLAEVRRAVGPLGSCHVQPGQWRGLGCGAPVPADDPVAVDALLPGECVHCGPLQPWHRHAHLGQGSGHWVGSPLVILPLRGLSLADLAVHTATPDKGPKDAGPRRHRGGTGLVGRRPLCRGAGEMLGRHHRPHLRVSGGLRRADGSVPVAPLLGRRSSTSCRHRACSALRRFGPRERGRHRALRAWARPLHHRHVRLFGEGRGAQGLGGRLRGDKGPATGGQVEQRHEEGSDQVAGGVHMHHSASCCGRGRGH
mmetsp:Transcript_101513/g.302829  ORF Transcript_101513/g.302829 Transcript_101513/m.302829 type:complete len:269 (-) Transcript_101513:129-935(-)